MSQRSKWLSGVALSICLTSAARADEACDIVEIAPLPGDEHVFVGGLNNWGQVAGWSFREGEGVTTPFVWRDGRVRTLPKFPEGGHAMAVSINDFGQVVGQGSLGGAFVPAIWSARGIARLPGLDGDRPTDINNRGQIVGSRYTSCLLWPNAESEPIALDTLGGDWCWPFAINDRGEVVGMSRTTTGELHGFIWTDGVMVDVGIPELPNGPSGWTESGLYDINNQGLAVGFVYSDSSFGMLTYRRESGARAVGPLSSTLAVSVNEWSSIAIVTGSPRRMQLSRPDGRSVDLGTMHGHVSDGVYLNERHQVAWNTSDLHGYFCELRSK